MTTSAGLRGGQITLHPGDNRISLRRLIDQGVRVHSVVTDAPYGLTSVVKRFGKAGAAPAKFGSDGAFARASGGFMGKGWDGTGIERDPEFWRLVYEVLLPGGFVFAFSGSRTGHWQACAMEIAGFVMHPMHGWVYGSGMPKASNAQRAVDAQVCDQVGRHYEVNLPVKDGRPGDHVCEYSEAGKAWAGWAYGTQSQKPALEPIYLAQRPYTEKGGGLNLLKHGLGAVNIDACRVAVNDQGGGTAAQGRWPANLLHDGSDSVVAMFPREAGASAPVRGAEPSSVTKEIYGKFAGRVPGSFFADNGSAARFFNGFPPTDEDYARAIASGLVDDVPALLEPLRYQPKAAKVDRAGSSHPTVKPIALMEWCIKHLTPPGGVVLDPFAGSGTTGEAARRLGFDCILMEAEPEYVDFLRRRFDLPLPPLPFDVAALLARDDSIDNLLT